MTDDKRFTKHGFPKGFRFVPTHLELLTILSHTINGRRLHPKVAAIFHELRILDYHPEELHDAYERDKEHRYIYFFSWRQFQNNKQQAGAAAGGGAPVHKKRQRGAGAGGQDDDDNEPRPVRLAKGGGWKPSGGGHVLRWPKDKGGFVAGKMVTMVFYDHRDGGEQVKSQWGMHEFSVPADPRQLSKPTKATLCLYRLYKLKSDDGVAGSNLQTLASVSAAAGGHFSAPCPAGQPSSFGIFTGRNQPLAAGASSSRMPPPPHRIPNAGHPPQYYHHHQYAFGAAPPATAAHQRVHTMTMPPPAYGTGMHAPSSQLLQCARPPGTGLPGRQLIQQFRRPPAAANLAAHQQASATPATYGGAGQEASHSGATGTTPPSAPVSTPPPPAAEIPSAAEELAPMTAATHGGAGGEEEVGGDFGATRSSQDATGIRPAEQDDATATAEPAGQHVQFADCVKSEEETVPVPPPIPPADNYGWPAMPELDWDLELAAYDERCLFTLEELCQTFDEPEPPLTQQGDNN